MRSLEQRIAKLEEMAPVGDVRSKYVIMSIHLYESTPDEIEEAEREYELAHPGRDKRLPAFLMFPSKRDRATRAAVSVMG